MALALATEIAWSGTEIAIGISHGTLGTHLGLVYPERQGMRMVHLAWHLRLHDEPFPKENWLATVIDLPATVRPQLVSLVRNLCKRYPPDARRADGITYGLNLVAGRGAIRQTGAYKPGKGCTGFTCASFVAEILRHFGLDLVRMEPHEMVRHPRNDAWAKAILCMLIAHRVDAEHVKRVEENFYGTRLRPEDVCAAVEVPVSQRPVHQAAILARGDQIFAEVLERCGPWPGTIDAFMPCRDAYITALQAIDLDEATAAAAAGAALTAGDQDSGNEATVAGFGNEQGSES